MIILTIFFVREPTMQIFGRFQNKRFFFKCDNNMFNLTETRDQFFSVYDPPRVVCDRVVIGLS